MPKVLVVGDANVDIIVPYPKIIDPEKGLASFETPTLQGGGTAANTAIALSRIGVETAFLGTVGNDSYGKFVAKDFKNEGIDVAHLIIDPSLNTVGVFAFIDDSGERYLWGWPREQQAFKEIAGEYVNENTLKDINWVHSSGMAVVHDSSARSSILKLFTLAQQAGIPTSFDLNLRVDDGQLDPEYKEAVLKILEQTNYVLGSAKDEYAYIGTTDNWLDNVKELVSKERVCIVRNGSHGSLIVTEEEQAEVPAFRITVKDTVGAGDTYNAGFIKGMLHGEDLPKCLFLGNAVAGYTVSKIGARNCPRKVELATFIEEHGG